MKIGTMITRHGEKREEANSYTIVLEDYSVLRMSCTQIAQEIKNGNLKLTNLDLENGQLVGTNGALAKYTFIRQDGTIEGKARPVILNRVEKNGELVGYTVFTTKGTIAELNVAMAVQMYKSFGIANGKIRHTEKGDIISSINGNYMLRKIEIKKAPLGNIKVSVLMVCEAFDKTIGAKDYAGVIISGSTLAGLKEVYDNIMDDAADVRAKAFELGGKTAREALAPQRIDATMMYVVISLDKLRELKKRKYVKVEAKLANSFVISRLEYRDKEEYEETKFKAEYKEDKLRILAKKEEVNEETKRFIEKVYSVFE